METHFCSCGKSHIIAESVDEEMYLITINNCEAIIGRNYVNYICNECGEIICHYDREMTVE